MPYHTIEVPSNNKWVDFIEQIAACFAVLVLSPLIAINALIALLSDKKLVEVQLVSDCLGRKYKMLKFTCGYARSSAQIFSLIKRRISIIGLPTLGIYDARAEEHALPFLSKKLGLINSLYASHRSGLTLKNPLERLYQQFYAPWWQKGVIAFSYFFASFFYGNASKPLAQPTAFGVFGIRVNNVSMSNAISWCLAASASPSKNCQVGVFLNVNSVNLALKNSSLMNALNRADQCFADGSGIRIAAKHGGIRVRENVNGTDMFPLLCEAASEMGRSIYLLGGEPGVADTAVQKMRQRYPHLRIAGFHHGFFQDEDAMIANINHSGADILLVALGSPRQEEWLLRNADKLHCHSALAVGGLFDFVAGKFSRAPVFLRENGLEWVWRLVEDPKTKFKRYVLGNPLFLFRTFVQKQAKVRSL